METQWRRIVIRLARHIYDNKGGCGNNAPVPMINVVEKDVIEYYKCKIRRECCIFSPGLMLVHKDKISFRPIIDNSIRLGSPLEGYILEKLNIILSKVNVYNVNNSEMVL